MTQYNGQNKVTAAHLVFATLLIKPKWNMSSPRRVKELRTDQEGLPLSTGTVETVISSFSFLKCEICLMRSLKAMMSRWAADFLDTAFY
jgi:hypothetical protein